MSTTGITSFELQQDGQPPRLFRFPNSPITIGFAPGCNLSLEPARPEGAQISIEIKNQAAILKTKAESFQLNGVKCAGETSVHVGDVISTGAYKILIRNLPIDAAKIAPPTPAPPAPVPAGEPSKPEATPKSVEAVISAPPVPEVNDEAATHAAKPPSQKATKAGLEYLYLFFGPIAKHLMDDDVSEVMINGPAQVFLERKGKVVAIPERFSSEQALQAAVMNVARSVGRFFDRDNPRLDARLPDGSRVHAVIPPLCRAGTIVAIRKFRKEKLTIQQLVNYGSITAEGARLLDIIVKLGRNLIVSGATSSGKTSVLNVLSSLIPEHDRILVMEDASELQLQQVHKVCFETRKADEYGKGEVTIRDLLNSALRLRPDRIVVGEIRGGEALDLLQAMNTGHDGSMSTIHANTPRDSLSRLETCSLFSGVEIPLSALREQVASAIHIVIQTARLHDGTRKITAITEILGLKDREYQFEDIYRFEVESIDPDGKVRGRHMFTGYRPTFCKSAEQYGFDLKGLFQKA
ncbi:MAG TPA: ATPase, T2SS/T4P/T4SS family [Candidatus Sulfotelmatobacter sp.]|jgi:pilus assembly protein CpaF|nr:ATPase, T2SS/T4P/T4SS family [Candidatus Sulfotelmatobacter sp.]